MSKANICHFCGKRIYLSVSQGRSSGWVHGEVFGVHRMIQVHLECYFAALDKLRDGKTGKVV